MGLLDQAKGWMTPERAIGMQGLGMALSQLDAGRPVDLSPAYAALEQRKSSQQMRKVLDTPGVLDGFTPQQRAILASMPEQLAVQIIGQRAFEPAPQGPAPTDDMREYDLARAQGYGGSFQDYMIEMRRAGATNITNTLGGGQNVPVPEKGYQNQFDADGNFIGQAAIPGSEAFNADMLRKMEAIDKGEVATAAEDKTGGMRDTSTEVIVTAADRAREAANAGWFDSGLVGNAIAEVSPESQAAEKRRQVNALKANASAENIAAMRQASPTGAALGAVSDRDIALLADKTGALDAAASDEQFFRALDDYERTLLSVIHGPERGEEIYRQTRRAEPTEMDDDAFLKSLGLK